MAEKKITSFTSLNLYRAEEDSAILSRQNSRYTHSYSLPIKSEGTALLLMRTREPLTDNALQEYIEHANHPEFKIIYFQVLATCNIGSETLVGHTFESSNAYFADALTTTYKTTITLPSGYKAKEEDLFAANSLGARAQRQGNRATETTVTDAIEKESADGNYLALVLIAAVEKEDDGTPTTKGYYSGYVFEQGEGEDEEFDGSEIKDYLNSTDDKITEVQILGYFPKDFPDFKAFLEEDYKITIGGNATLRISEEKIVEETND